MGQGDDVGFHWRQQDRSVRRTTAAFQHFGHFGRRGHINDTLGVKVGVQGSCEGAQGRTGDTDNRILLRQPDAADGLAPQHLLFDDLAGTVMDGAVEPYTIHQSVPSLSKIWMETFSIRSICLHNLSINSWMIW